jgi:membrane-associated phospholipid phosphatase
MTTHPATLSAEALQRRSLRAGSVAMLAIVCAAWLGGAACASETDGMFLPGHDGHRLWEHTLATVRADWPVVRAEPPDFLAEPPRPGIIESAWVEPPAETDAGLVLALVPRRQRVVVRMVPASDGAWIEAVVQTQSLSGEAAGGDGIELVGTWQRDPGSDTRDITVNLAAQLAPVNEQVFALPPPDERSFPSGAQALPPVDAPPWAGSRYPRASRAWHQVASDYRNFYSCGNLTCLAGAFGAGALMANTGFDSTMQTAWINGVKPTNLGTFFSGCKDIGEGRYSLPIFGAAYATGLVFEGNPFGDVVGEWGGRSLRMFAVGAPPVYALQWATGASRPSDGGNSYWAPFADDNGVSGHAFVGAIPFIAAADMAEGPLLKGTLYVCSTFVAFSRMTDNAHYPSQAFLGWYMAFASARAVSQTEMRFGGMEVRVVPLPIADQGGLAVEARW